MKAPTGIRFTEEEHADISRYAKAAGLSFSDVVRRAARAYVAPDKAKGYRSLRQLSNSKDEDMQLAFGQFLDDFAHAKDKAALIEDEPEWTSDEAGRWYYDFAATAHKLADDNGLPVPSWCLQDKYFASTPQYAFDTTDSEFREYLEQSTPREFAWHGLFLGPNVLARA